MEENNPAVKHMNKQNAPTPTIRDFPEETICPSCGKFVGAYTRCPYCGSEHKHRFSIRFFRIFALAVSIGGLFLIWLAARGIRAPLMLVKDIGPMNSFAYVRVEGETVRTRTYDDGGVSFWVDDGTGTLMVRAYADTGKALADQKRIPAAGDRVSAEGTLNFREDLVTMIVNIPEKVVIEKGKPLSTEISSIGPGQIGKSVEITGVVREQRGIPKGIVLLIADPSGAIDLVLWSSILQRHPGAESIVKPGTLLRIRGTVGEYREKLQVVPTAPDDVSIASDVE